MNFKNILNFWSSFNTTAVDKTIIHQICKDLYDFGFTEHRLEDVDALNRYDKNFYATALLYKIVNDGVFAELTISDLVSPYVFDCINELNYIKTSNPFCDVENMERISKSYDIVIVIKALEYIKVTYNTIKTNSFGDAKVYFHKADILWNKIYHTAGVQYGTDKPMCNLWKEIAKLNIILEKDSK